MREVESEASEEWRSEECEKDERGKRNSVCVVKMNLEKGKKENALQSHSKRDSKRQLLLRFFAKKIYTRQTYVMRCLIGN